MSDDSKKLTKSSSKDIDAFLKKVAQTPAIRQSGQRGKLMFAMDATASREATWDHACHLQAEMFNETASLGGLDIQLCYYRGFAEFDVTPWYSDSQQLLKRMTAVSCLGGHTQIEKVIRHAINEAEGNFKTFPTNILSP